MSGRLILAPMVRSGTLPLRLLSLRHGADIVYTEEIMDMKIVNARRVVNDKLGTIDYVVDGRPIVKNSNKNRKKRRDERRNNANNDDGNVGNDNSNSNGDNSNNNKNNNNNNNDNNNNNNSNTTANNNSNSGSNVEKEDDVVFFRTCAEERGKCVLQLGAADAETAVRAAKVVEGDIAGIDVNMGCPLPFSVHRGAGSALLSKPETARDIISALSKSLSIPVTAKMRIMENHDDSVKFAKMLEEAGATAIAVHARYKHERPREDSHWDVIPEIVEAVNCPVIVNGSVFTADDIPAVRSATRTDDVMVARGALFNASMFRGPGSMFPGESALRDFTRLCIRYDNSWGYTKYTLNLMAGAEGADKNLRRDIAQTRNWFELAKVMGIADDYARLYKFLTFRKFKKGVLATPPPPEPLPSARPQRPKIDIPGGEGAKCKLPFTSDTDGVPSVFWDSDYTAGNNENNNDNDNDNTDNDRVVGEKTRDQSEEPAPKRSRQS